MKNHVGLFLLLLTCSLAVFFINMTFTDLIPLYIGIALKFGLIVFFAITSLVLYHNLRLKQYWNIFFAFLTASVALFGGLYLSKLGLLLLNLNTITLAGFTAYKLLEDFFIIVLIIVMTHFSANSMASLYLKKGNIKYGMLIGLTSFVLLSCLAVLMMSTQNIPLPRLLELSPVILFIALGDGFMEELLFRGLFLKRLQPFFGSTKANIFTALVFCLVHLQVTFTPSLPAFLIVVFLLGILWGYIMQQTDSLFASALFHAGADVVIMIPFLQSYNVV